MFLYDLGLAVGKGMITIEFVKLTGGGWLELFQRQDFYSFLFLSCAVRFVFVLSRFSCGLGWLQTQYVAEAGPELLILLPVSQAPR